MKLVNIAVVLAVAATLPVIAAQASEHRHAAKDACDVHRGMRVVAVSPSPGEPGHGWQYFSDTRKARAVVISPQGDYFYSRGHGMKQVFKAGATT